MMLAARYDEEERESVWC